MIVKYLFISGFLFLFYVSGAQQPVQERISGAGGNYLRNGISLNWSLGTTVAPTLRSGEGKLVLTHGFQEKITVTPIKEDIVSRLEIMVYPNPVSGILKISFPEPPGGRVGLEVSDTEGRVVVSEQSGGSEEILELDLQSLSPGLYFLRVNKDRSSNVYRVIKL